MIVSYKNKFIFFKPLKTAGTSVEAALSNFCGENDIFTGSVILSEILDKRYDMSPRNNYREAKIISGDEARKYLEHHGRVDLLNSGFNKFQIVDDPIYHEHTSPIMFDFTDETAKFTKVSMVRNPYDMMVSYFWWTYNSPIDDVISFNRSLQIKKKGHQQLANYAPKLNDSIKTLKYKFEAWIDLPAWLSDGPKPSHGESISYWFSDWSNEFFNYDDIDFYIRFENIEKDYKTLCELLNKESNELPQFKNKIRKTAFHYEDYYTPAAKKVVQSLFSKTIDKFDYSFNLL